MSLKDQWVPIRFQLGVETEQDDKTLIPGQLTALENGVFDRRVTISKRAGNERLPRTRIGAFYSAVSGTIGLATRDDGEDLVMLASTSEVLSYAPEDEGWVRRGDWVHVHLNEEPLPRRPYESWDGTTCSTGSVRLVAWEDARGGVYAQLLNDQGVSYGPDFRIGGGLGRSPRALRIGTGFQVYFVSGTTPPTLHSAVINAADPTTGAARTTQLCQLWDAAPYYGVAPIGDAANAALVAASQSGSIYLMVVRENGGIGTTTTTPAYPNPISGTHGTEIAPEVIVSDDGAKAVVFHKTFAPLSGVQAWTIDVASFSSTSNLIDMDVNPVVNGYGKVRRVTGGFLTASNGVYTFQALVEMSASDAADRYLRRSVANTTASVALASGTLLRHSSLASQQFRLGTEQFVWATHVSTLQSTDFLVRADDGLVCGWSRPGQALADVSGVLGNIDVQGTVGYRAATNREQLPLAIASFSGSAFADRDLKLVSVRHHPSSSWRPVDVDGVLHMPGGWLGIYDGANVTEHGFALKSEGGTVTPYGSAGNITAGSYLWAAVPEAFDARGNRHLGGFVQFLQATLTGSNNSGTLDLRTITHTVRDGTRAPHLRFGVYRSGPNGTVLQRVGTVVNDPTVDTVRFVDNVSEANRSVGEVIYAQEGGGPEKMNSMPLAPKTLAMAGDRLYLAGLEGEPYTIAASKLILGGAVAFADGDEMSVESRGGDITNLSAIDSNVAIYKRDRLYTAASVGPDNDANDSTPFPEPEKRTSDVGAPSPGIVVEAAGTTVQGLVFWSHRGARLLGRDGVVQDIGGPVRGFDNLTVIGGIAPSTHDEVRLYTAEGTTLVLNTRFNQWSTCPKEPAVAACDWDGRPTYAWENGSVWAESTGSYLDGGTPYSTVIETGWLSLEGIQGMARVRDLQIVGNYYSPHTLRVEMAYDYRDSWRTVREIDVTGALGIIPYGGTSGSAGTYYGAGGYGGSDPVYQFRVEMNPQRLQSFRVRLTDVGATGRSFDLTELKVRVAVDTQRARLATRKVK